MTESQLKTHRANILTSRLLHSQSVSPVGGQEVVGLTGLTIGLLTSALSPGWEYTVVVRPRKYAPPCRVQSLRLCLQRVAAGLCGWATVERNGSKQVCDRSQAGGERKEAGRLSRKRTTTRKSRAESTEAQEINSRAGELGWSDLNKDPPWIPKPEDTVSRRVELASASVVAPMNMVQKSCFGTVILYTH